MDVPTVVISATIAGASAAAAALAVSHYKDLDRAEKNKAEIENAYANGHTRGWHEGQDALMNRFSSQVQPQDFTQVP